MIERCLLEDPRVGPEAIANHHIICGDARTMQGQERSVAFLSMVADPSSATAQTKKVDQQRINVAMSRAADRLYLVRSVARSDLRDTDIKAKVLDHFLEPMPEGRKYDGHDILDRCDSDFERAVLTRLLHAGYRARPQVSAAAFSIDIVVEGQDDRRLAIELDGDRYQGPEVWDRDMARQAALERAGWTFWRVFGSQWESMTDVYWSDLTGTVEEMGIEPIGEAAVSDIFTEFRVIDRDLLHAAPEDSETSDEDADEIEAEGKKEDEPVNLFGERGNDQQDLFGQTTRRSN